MLINRFEKRMMNNRLRAAIQRHVEARWLLGLGGPMRGGMALEMGCGRGVGVELILDLFGAERVEAFDLDPHMVALAERRLAGRGAQVKLWTGDVTAIAAADQRYDAVFDFGIVHHVPAWREALREAWRVLKPGGTFYAEEVFERFVCHPLARWLLDHPQQDRFDLDGLRDALADTGFTLLGSRQLAGLCGWVVAGKPAR